MYESPSVWNLERKRSGQKRIQNNCGSSRLYVQAAKLTRAIKVGLLLKDVWLLFLLWLWTGFFHAPRGILANQDKRFCTPYNWFKLSLATSVWINYHSVQGIKKPSPRDPHLLLWDVNAGLENSLKNLFLVLLCKWTWRKMLGKIVPNCCQQAYQNWRISVNITI